MAGDPIMIGGEAVATAGEARVSSSPNHPVCCCASNPCDCASVPWCVSPSGYTEAKGHWVNTGGASYTYVVDAAITGNCCCGFPAVGRRSRIHVENQIVNQDYRFGGCPGGVISRQVIDYTSDGTTYNLRVETTFCGNSGCGPCNTQINTSSGPETGSGIGCIGGQALGPGLPNVTWGTNTPAPYPLADGPFGASANQVTAPGSWRNSCTSMEGEGYFALNEPGFGITRTWTSLVRGYLEPSNALCTSSECRMACCLPGGSCRDGITKGECLSLGGVPQGAGTTCYNQHCDNIINPTDLGACCDPATGLCVMSSQAACQSPKVWRGPGVPCAPNPCPPPIGACCVGTVCSQQSQSACAAAGGVWYGLVPCDPSPCTPQGGGACCRVNTGLCDQVTSSSLCPSPDLFQGVGSDCQAVQCPQPGLGACCTQISHGFDCQVTSQASCSAGTWYPGLSCSPFPCTGGGGGLFEHDQVPLGPRPLGAMKFL